MSYYGQHNKFSMRTRSNGEDARFSVLIHSAEDYEQKFGHMKLLELYALCPNVTNHLKHAEKSNQMLFILWMTDEKITRNVLSVQALQQRQAYERLLEFQEDARKKILADAEWGKNFQEYFKEIALQIQRNARLEDEQHAIREQNRMKELYLSLIISLKEMFDKNVASLFVVRNELLKQAERFAKIVRILENHEADKILDLMANLPPMDKEHEALKDSVISQANDFKRSKSRDISTFAEKITEALDKLKHYLTSHTNKNNASLVNQVSNVVDGFQDRCSKIKSVARAAEKTKETAAGVTVVAEKIQNLSKVIEKAGENSQGNLDLAHVVKKQFDELGKQVKKEFNALANEKDQALNNIDELLRECSPSEKSEISPLMADIHKGESIINSHSSEASNQDLGLDLNLDADEAKSEEGVAPPRPGF